MKKKRTGSIIEVSDLDAHAGKKAGLSRNANSNRRVPHVVTDNRQEIGKLTIGGRVIKWEDGAKPPNWNGTPFNLIRSKD